MNKKILIITNIPAPSRIPLFEYLAQKLPNFSVWFLAETESIRSWGVKKNLKFKHKFLKSLHLNLIKNLYEMHLNFIFFKLIKKNPKIIIAAYDQPAYWQGFIYCKIFKKKFILFNGSTLLSSKKLNGAIGILKKIIIKYSDSYITYGSKASEYLEYFGADKNKIITGCNTVDIDKIIYNYKIFIKSAEYLELKNKFKFDKIFLLASRLVKYKGIENLINIIDKLNKKKLKQKFCLIIAGSGDDEKYFKNLIKEKNIHNIFFIGFIEQQSIYKYYSISDFFIFPTQNEPWGLVVNEALACGNYVLCSDKAGAAYDLIKENINGNILNFNKYDNVINLIKKNINKKIDRDAIIKTINKFNIKYSGDKIIEAINK